MQFRDGHVEKFLDEGSSCALASADARRTFDAVAYSGAEVERAWGRMVLKTSGMKRDAKMGMLIEHDDLSGVAVCTSSDVEGDSKLRLKGYFLSDKASGGLAGQLIAKADEGWPLKMSVGIRFKKYHDLNEGDEEEVNGAKFKGPITVVDESHLFETSFIYCRPADRNTGAAVLKEQLMADDSETVDREAILAEGRRLERTERQERENALLVAFPGDDHKDLRERCMKENKSVEEAKLIAAETALVENAKLKKEAAEREAAIKNIEAQFAHTGLGFDASKADTSVKNFRGLPLDERLTAEFADRPVLDTLWDEDSRRAYKAFLKVESRKGKNRMPLISERFVDAMAHSIIESAKNDPRFNAAIERLAAGNAGKAGPDLARIVVKGFIGSFYQSYEEEFEPSFGNRLTFQIESNQETEIVRWLGAAPQLQVWKGPRIAKDIPIFTQLIQNILYESTLDVDKFDFNNQKFGLISRLFGEQGSVTSQHWDVIITALLEANPTAYDGKAFFAATHTLGGDSGTMVNDLTSAVGFGSLAVADPSNPTQTEAAKILLQCIPQLRTFKWANGMPMNGKAREFAVLVPPKYEGVFFAAINSERLDTGQSNPLHGNPNSFEIIPNAYFTATNKYVYIARMDAGMRMPILRAEPAPIEMTWMGPGTTYAFEKHKYAAGFESTRSVAPGAWESMLRLTIGAP